MAERICIHRGTWWRFPQYHIVDGYIRPKPGLKVEPYKLWDAYESAGTEREGNERTTSLPYFSLIDLIRRLPKPYAPMALIGDAKLQVMDDELTLTPEEESLIVEWCNQYGLLGLLSHQAHGAVMFPRWESGGQAANLFDSVEVDSDPPILRPIMRRYVREEGGWVCERLNYSEGPPSELLRNRDVFHGAFVEPDDRDKGWPVPGVYMSETLIGNNWTFQPFRQGWKIYFPDVQKDEAETYMYPLPLSETFWHAYAEPLMLFVAAARRFCDALELLVEYKRELGVMNPQIPSMALECINALAGHSTISLVNSEKGFVECWKAPSLLSAFALMAIHDLTGGRFIGRCAICGEFFRAEKHYHAKYCSKKCKKRSEWTQGGTATKKVLEGPRACAPTQADEQVKKVRDIWT